MQMRQRDVAALDAKIHEGVIDAKAENDALRDDVAAGRRQFVKAVCQCVKPPPPPAWIMQPLPPTLGHAGGLFLPSERGDHYAKNNWKEPEVY